MLWSYRNVLREDGISFQNYLAQQITLLFPKMAQKRQELGRRGLAAQPEDSATMLGLVSLFRYSYRMPDVGKSTGLKTLAKHRS